MDDKKIKYSHPVPPFVRYCSAIIPTMFDDSLSYYEALCALWKWLQDNLVKVVNQNAAVTDSYIKIVDELKSYVENYFANLDVQEEINNKLDAMVESGQFQEFIDEYLRILTETYIISDITYEKGEIDGTEYYIAYVPHLDSNGDAITLKHGFANDVNTAQAIADDTAREFALRNYATFAVNASIFGIDEEQTNYGHAMGTIIKDGSLVSTYDTAGYTDATQARMRLVGVKSDGSLKTYAINASYDSLIADGVVNTFAGYGTYLEGGVITGDYLDEVGIWNYICQKSDTKDLMFICCNGRGIQNQAGLTPRQMMNIVISKGYDYAFQIDAGGSTCFVEQGIMVNMPYDDFGRTVRQTPDYIYFGKTPQTNVDFNIARVTTDASDADIETKINRNRISYLQGIDNNYLDIKYPNIRHNTEEYDGVHIRYIVEGEPNKQIIFGNHDHPKAITLYDNETNSPLFRADGDTKEILLGGLRLADFFTEAQNITDYDDKTDSGVWRVGGNATNKPWAATIGGICINFAGVSGGTLQIAIPQTRTLDSYPICIRNWNGTSWTGWFKFALPEAV